MKKYFWLVLLSALIFSVNALSVKTIDLKTELVFGESEDDENTLFSTPSDIAVDEKGFIYVSDWRDNCIKKFSPDGKYILTIGRKGEGPGEFSGLYFIQIIDNQIVASEYNRRQFFDLDGNYLKVENAEVLFGFKRQLFFDHGKSYIGYYADMLKSTYKLETGEFNKKNSVVISVLDAGRNARVEKDSAYLRYAVLYSFDILPSKEIVYAKDGDNRDVFIFSNGKSRKLFVIKGAQVECSDKEKEQYRIQREELKGMFDIPEIKFRSIVKDVKCYKDRIYIWIETKERFGWLCIDNKGNEIAFYSIGDKNLTNIKKTCFINDYIYYLVIDPDKGVVVKKSKLLL